MKKEDDQDVVAFRRVYVVVRLADELGQHATMRQVWLHRYFGGRSARWISPPFRPPIEFDWFRSNLPLPM